MAKNYLTPQNPRKFASCNHLAEITLYVQHRLEKHNTSAAKKRDAPNTRTRVHPSPSSISTTLSEKFLLFVGAGDGVGELEARSTQEPRTVRRRRESDNSACQLRGTAEAAR